MGAQADPLLVAVAPDAVGPGPGDEGVAVWSATGADLGGHALTDGEATWAFPPGARLAPGEVAWVVGNTDAWRAAGGPEPRWAWHGIALGNDGDDLVLRGPNGPVDAFAFGTALTRGQEGSVSHVSPGLVYWRFRDGDGFRDTDHAGDWRTPRLHRLGESAWAPRAFEADSATLFVAPDASLQTVAQTIAGARERLHLHVYDLRHAALVDALVTARQTWPHLDLRVLVDRRPVGQESLERHETAWALQRIVEAGGQAFVAGNDRYAYHHLKVLVADDAVLVGSENWVPSGHPSKPSWGNRGWGIVVRSPSLADHVADVLSADRAAFDTTPFALATYDPGFERPMAHAPRQGTYEARWPPVEVPGPLRIHAVVGPDATGDPAQDPILARIAGAQRRVLAEQLDLSTRSANRLGWQDDDNLLLALEAAAARGAEVKVLVAGPFRPDDDGNARALEALRSRAPAVQGRVFGVPDLVLHNKGFVVDDALVVGSQNANHASRSANREFVLIVESDVAANHLAAVFMSDWHASPAGRDWGAVRDDLEGLAAAPLVPTLLLTAAVVAALRWR